MVSAIRCRSRASFAIVFAASLAACNGGVTVPHSSVVSGSGDAAARAAARVDSAPEGAQLLVWNGTPGSSQYGPSVNASAVQFAAGAWGNASPLRSFLLPSYPTYLGSKRNFWTAPANAMNVAGQGLQNFVGRYSETGSQLMSLDSPADGKPHYNFFAAGVDREQNLYVARGALVAGLTSTDCQSRDNVIYEYSVASSWKKIVREIEVRNGFWSCVSSIAVDGKGDIFLGSFTTTGQVYEYGPGASGRAVPIRILRPAAVSYAPVLTGGIDTDQAGNLFWLQGESLFEFAVGSATGQQLLAGAKITAFALDSQDHIYVAVQTAPPSEATNPYGLYAVEEYAPSGAKLERTIAGPQTGLVQPAGIAVAP
jgi:hypothetical protein